jgi:hypothetical protein
MWLGVEVALTLIGILRSGRGSTARASDKFPTTVRRSPTFSDKVKQWASLRASLKQSVTIKRRATNQVVGGSNPSGHAIPEGERRIVGQNRVTWLDLFDFVRSPR